VMRWVETDRELQLRQFYAHMTRDYSFCLNQSTRAAGMLDSIDYCV